MARPRLGNRLWAHRVSLEMAATLDNVLKKGGVVSSGPVSVIMTGSGLTDAVGVNKSVDFKELKEAKEFGAAMDSERKKLQDELVARDKTILELQSGLTDKLVQDLRSRLRIAEQRAASLERQYES